MDFQATLACHPDGLILLDSQNSVIFTNEAARALANPDQLAELFETGERPTLVEFKGSRVEVRWQRVDHEATLGVFRTVASMPNPDSETLRDFEERALRAEARALESDERFRRIYLKAGPAVEKFDEAEERASEAEKRMAEAMARAEEAERAAARAEERTLEANVRFRRIYEMSGVEELERRAEQAESRAEQAEQRAQEAESSISLAENSAKEAEERAQRAEARTIEANERFRLIYEKSGPAVEKLQALEETLHSTQEQVETLKSELEKKEEAARRATMVTDAARWKTKNLEKELEQEQADRERYQLALREASHRIRALEERLNLNPDAETQRLAFEDNLTGLPNANILPRTVENQLRHSNNVAVLAVDIDRFRVVNDTLGQKAGDRLLVELGSRLKACSAQLVCRRGEDEFFLVLFEPPTSDQVLQKAQELAKQVFELVSKPFELKGQRVRVTTSIGISASPNDGRTWERLHESAERALFQAKQQGRCRVETYSAELDTRIRAKLTLESQLRTALEKGELLLHYQPIVKLENRRVVGVEALLRWSHPVRGLLSPGEFLEVAQEFGLIVPIGEWVLRSACERASSLPGNLYASVNISPHQLIQAEFVEKIIQVLDQTALPPEKLVIEIPEGLHNLAPEQTRLVLDRLSQAGVGLGIDDFGTGYSSLRELESSKVRFLKIDQALVSALPEDPHSVAMCKAVIGLATSLGVPALAEGIETQKQADYLSTLGCKLAQGFLYSKPLPTDMVSRLLAPR